MKSIVILGSTGSIGTQTLDIVRRLPGRFRVVGLAAHRNAELLAQQAIEFNCDHVCLGSETANLSELKEALGSHPASLHQGVEGMCELATLPDADLIVMAVAGAIGIRPSHAALSAGKSIALASKEVLVAAGEQSMELARRNGCRILPIDSEHSALFQCLEAAPDRSRSGQDVSELILTASGGPFRTWTKEAMDAATPAQALKHPTWNMGGLVTINSSTLMNKGLEVIEAHWLFDVPAERISVMVHPQSIVHSMVRFMDGSVLAQLGLPDMRLPIQYALVYPERVDSQLPHFDLTQKSPLEFEEPDQAKFPSIGLARAALKAGGTMPAVMNAANEAAVDLFLKDLVSFPGIMRTVELVMNRHAPVEATFEAVLEADRWARAEASAVNGVSLNV